MSSTGTPYNATEHDINDTSPETVVVLKKPITISGEVVTRITITKKDITFDTMVAMNKSVMERDPHNPKQIYWRPKNEVEIGRSMLAFFIGATEKEAGKLLMDDSAEIMKAIEPFLPSSPDETETSK